MASNVPASPTSPASVASPKKAKRPKPHPMQRKKTAVKRGKDKSEKPKESKDAPGLSSDGAQPPEANEPANVKVASAPLTPPEAPVAGHPQSKTKFTICVTVITAATLIFGAVAFVKFTMYVPSVITCVTPGCIKHSEELRNAMNTAIKPCDNFYSFVCGSWKPMGKERSMIERILNHSLYIAIEELQGDPEKAPVPIAQRHFQSCMAQRSKDLVKSEVEKLKSFKRGLGLTWPEEWPETGRNGVPPLVILLNLTVNWNLNLFFNLRAMPAFRNRPKTLYMGRGNWKPEAIAYTDQQFADLVKQHCAYLEVPPSGDLKKLKAHVQFLQDQLPIFTPDGRYEQKQTLKQIDQSTTSDKDEWWDYLNQIYRPHFTWSRDDIVLIEHPEILTRLQTILDNMTAASFRMSVAWVFIRICLWKTVGKPELRYVGDASTLQSIRVLTCLGHVQSVFGLVVSARHIHERFTKSLRGTINQFFNIMRDQIKLEFANATWIDPVVKKKAIVKLEGIWQSMLPDNRFFSTHSLAALYKNFPDATDSFVQNIVSGSKAIRKLVASDDYVTVYAKQLGKGSKASRYSYYYNSVSLFVGALEPPLLYADGTFAMLYGSMGTILAASMIRSFDERGIVYDEKGMEVNWWSAGNDEYKKRIKCDMGITSSAAAVPLASPGTGNVSAGSSPQPRPATDTYVNPLYSKLLAIYASYKAYRLAVKDTKGPDVQKLVGLEDYTDDQVFLMTYCLMTCAVDSNGDECNVPLRHLSKFAAAFKCGPKDAMNPKDKCTFFE